jgi:hypothetical protein
MAARRAPDEDQRIHRQRTPSQQLPDFRHPEPTAKDLAHSYARPASRPIRIFKAERPVEQRQFALSRPCGA